ncbi:lengsin-like [Acanthaster planci]|uniref:Lengsin n=1 Tax=Acanthaster planci TaxID=133434 RepID=A0A8B7Z0E8_ACAPL|nr:lengsin-like [Acanthaster planci]
MADHEDADSIIMRMRNSGANAIRFEISDFFDRSHSTVVPQNKYHQLATEGLEFPLRGVFNDTDNTFKSVYHEKIGTLKPDFDSTLLRLPLSRGVALTLAEPQLDGNPLPTYPRYIARKQLQRLSELGFTLKSAFHLQFFLEALEERISPDLLADFLDVLRGVAIEPLFLNTGKLNYYIDGTYKEKAGIKGADNAHLFKTFVKAAAVDKGLDVSFFSKFLRNRQIQQNCFLYFRHSLWDAEGKKDVTHDPESPSGLTEVAQHWLAGILEHMPAITRFMFPTDFCWKHRSTKTETVNDKWEKDSTGSSVRLHVGGEGKTFMETRQGTGRCNPYLLLAAVVAAGIDGMKKKLPLPESGTDSGREMPTFSRKAMEAFEADEVLINALGARENFIKLLKATYQDID